MQYTKLGKTDLNVSRVCLGCMGFGDPAHGQHTWTLEEEASRGIIRRALELGVNFFDTAIVYQNGTSEQYLGRALKDFARREDVVVATKFPVRTQAEIDGGISGQEHVLSLIHISISNTGPCTRMLLSALVNKACSGSVPMRATGKVRVADSG